MIGFEDGFIKFDDIQPPKKFAGQFLPNGDFTTHVKIHFCCRDDGTWSDPITLPTHDSFVLFRHSKFPCQKVVGKYVKNIKDIFLL